MGYSKVLPKGLCYFYFTLRISQILPIDFLLEYLLMTLICFFSSSCLNELESVVNNELALVLKYCATNKLSVNLKKTNYMLILSAKKTVNININNIERRSFVKYLGVYIDEHLNWEPQIQHVDNKLAKKIRILHKIRKYVDLNVLKQLNYSLVYPYLGLGLGLGIMSWGSACKTRLTTVLTKQNQCIWCMFFAHRTESAKIYHALLEILELNNIYKLRIALFVHKIKK